MKCDTLLMHSYLAEKNTMSAEDLSSAPVLKTMYEGRCGFNTVTPVEVVRETDDMVWYKSGGGVVSRRKEGSSHIVAETREEAWDLILGIAQAEVDKAQFRLDLTKDRFERARDIRDADMVQAKQAQGRGKALAR